ncbi:MAG: polysaccharide biosynthesis tyrosine autokinase [Paucimonas sp.]|nr:polysaccharide biosynthesis tyrosine autokinase [Paucimonas sp.]
MLSIPLMQQQQPEAPASSHKWLAWMDILNQQRRFIFLVACAACALSALIALALPPAYEANILLQVKENEGRDRVESADGIAPREGKVQASTEIEMLRSRAVLGPVVTKLGREIVARPLYIPLVGSAIARWNRQLSSPGLTAGYVWGGERIVASAFTVPEELEGERFTLTVLGGGNFRIEQSESGIRARGIVGTTTGFDTRYGPVELKVDALDGQPGARFTLQKLPHLTAVQRLGLALNVQERGRQTGLVHASLRGDDPREVTRVLNAIGAQFVELNAKLRADEAERALEFLNSQLPALKQSVETAERRSSDVRSRKGAVDPTEEARTILQQAALAQAKSAELRQRRQELLTRFQPGHPAVDALDAQIAEAGRAAAAITARMRDLPPIQRDVGAATRDLEVNKDVYANMLHLSRQLALAQLGKLGNVRLIDQAVMPRKPVWPVLPLVLALSAAGGLLLGLVLAVLRKILFARTEDPEELEHQFGLPVLATVPHSRLAAEYSGKRLLPQGPNQKEPDGVVDSLRALRSALQFIMRESGNNVVMMAGPTQGLGKSFLCGNLAAILGSSGKRVLLVDADMRRGQLNDYFGVGREPGLSELLAGRALPAQVVRSCVYENVDLLPAGAYPERPAELLERVELERLFKHLSAHYDIILVDTPPVLPFSDALAVARHAAKILLAVRAGCSHVGEVEQAIKQLGKAGHAVDGMVFNDMKHRSISYRYGSAYGAKTGLYLPLPASAKSAA